MSVLLGAITSSVRFARALLSVTNEVHWTPMK